MQSDTVRQAERYSARIIALVTVLLAGMVMPVVVAQSDNPIVRFRGGGEIQVAVNGQSEAERTDAYRIGLRWLLQDYATTAGEQQVINHEATRQALAEPEKFVDAFEYTGIPEGQGIGALPMSPSVRDSGAATHWVTLQYSIPALNKLVAETRKSPDDADDESTGDSNSTDRQQAASRQALLWLLIEDQSLQLWVAPDTADKVVSRLTELAGSAGYQLDFPLFNVEELALVGPETLEKPGAEEEARLRESAARYRFSQMIAGTVKRKAAGGWQVSLIRLSASPAEQPADRFRSDADTLDSALQVLTGWMAGTIDKNGRLLETSANVQPSGFGATSGSTASIWISGSLDNTAIKRLRDYFNLSNAVERASLVELHVEGVLYQISPRSSLASVSGDLQAQSWLELGSREDSGFTNVQAPSGAPQSVDPATVDPTTVDPATNTDTTTPSAADTAFTTAVPEPLAPSADLYLRYVF